MDILRAMPCERPRRSEEASAERASARSVDASEYDGPRASGQRTDRVRRGRLIVEHINAIYTLIYAGVGNRPEAEELTFHVFALASPCLGRCTPGETVGLLVRVAGSVLEDHRRRSRARPRWSQTSASETEHA